MKIFPLIFCVSFLYFSCNSSDDSPLTKEENKIDTLNLSKYPVKYKLPKEVRETSGIEFYNGFLYTFNDSGNKPEIYKLDSQSGTLLQTISVKGASNIDWEEICRKGDTLFIGDFGNNRGIRKDLTIYSIILPQNNSSKYIEVDILHTYHFIFEDQIDFEDHGSLQTNFDCEAFVYYNNKLHIFSKRWLDYYVNHYELNFNSKESILTAKKVESFNVGFAVTGSDIYNNELYLIGYVKEGPAYTMKFTHFSKGKFFNGNTHKTFLGKTSQISQTEGIAISENNIYITGEEMKSVMIGPTLYILYKSDL